MIVKRGSLPATPHTEFYALPGVMALEEIHGASVFSVAYSRQIPLRRYPTEQVRPPVSAGDSMVPVSPKDLPLQPFHIKTGRVPYEGDYLARASRCSSGLPRRSPSQARQVDGGLLPQRRRP